MAGDERLPVNAAAIQGEPGTGYEDENGLGEFECGNCKYFGRNDGHGDDCCDQKDMKEKSKRPKASDGRVEVEDEGCCEYVKRLGPKKRAGWKQAAR